MSVLYLDSIFREAIIKKKCYNNESVEKFQFFLKRGTMLHIGWISPPPSVMSN